MKPFDGDADFDERLLPRLRAIPFFRMATDAEIDRSYEAYQRGDVAGLLAAWDEVGEPLRATLDGVYAAAYRSAAFMPTIVTGLSFLATLRGALRAGEHFRQRLRPDVAQALTTEFPWLEHRHEHIPDGWAPPLEFPDAYEAFIEGGTLDDARARWALTTALNEVQQQKTSRHLARLFGIPALDRHAAIERDLAVRYFEHAAPPATRALWRQVILILDGLNAAVFDGTSRTHAAAIMWRCTVGAVTRRGEWRAFAAALEAGAPR